MRWFVDTWDPAYGTSFDGDSGAGPTARSSAEVDANVEIPAATWAPRPAPADLRRPDVVLLVDGVRRNDAVLWTAEEDGTSYPGLAASYAAGVVRCDLRRGAAGLAAARVARGLFTSSPAAADAVMAGQVRYPVYQVRGVDPQSLAAAVQPRLTELEVEIAAETQTTGEELLVVDGPLRNRRQLPHTVGYVKTQQSQYLPARLVAAAVTALAPGQRSPVFRIGTRWPAYSWYLRLPGRRGAPWSGIVRVECSVECTVAQAVALADLSAVTLPRFASSPYKDPRAPQNLVPIAGLERRLRALLGDARLLHRALTITTTPTPNLVDQGLIHTV